MNVDVLQTHLSNLSQLLRAGGGKTTANELDELVQLLHPYRDKRVKDLMRTITDAENVLRAGPPPQKRQPAKKVNAEVVAAPIIDLYQRAGQLGVTPEEIVSAFAALEAANLTVPQLQTIAKQLGITEKQKKKLDLLNKMRQTVLDRRGMADRVNA